MSAAKSQNSSRLRVWALLGLVLAIGAALSVANVSLVRAAGAAIDVARLQVPVPETDPFSPLWNQAAEADIPLSAQQMFQPGGGSVQGVVVHAVQDGKRIAFLVSWADTTRNDFVKDLPSDAAAIQLPIDPLNLPYQCMGQSTSLVNIWQWKAAIQVTSQATGDPYNGTRNLTSDGMGKIASANGVQPTATGTWRDGRWYVIYSRDLAPADTGTAPLTIGLTSNAAFAVWDGAKGETRSMKAVSTWVPLTLPEEKPADALTYLNIAVTTVILAGLVALAWRLIPH